MNIRKFENSDAALCFKIRKEAYVRKFTDELNSEEIAACVDAYKAADYIRMAEESELFLVEEEGIPVGFFSIKRVNRTTAEIPLIYLRLDHLGRGIGRASIAYIEEWIACNWKEVDSLFLDTIIPKNNGGFYARMGFVYSGDTVCVFPGIAIKARRYAKKLSPTP